MNDIFSFQIDEVENVSEQMIEPLENWAGKAEIIKSVPG